LVNVKLSDVFAPTWIVAAPNALVSVGGAITVSVAVAAVPVRGSPSAPIAEIGPVLFNHAPGAVPWTVAEITQIPAGPRTPPDNVSMPDPANEAPPQFPVKLDGDAIAMPDGKVSVKATAVIPAVAGFVIVTDRVEVAPTTMVVGLKVLTAVGGGNWA
jgi:hypothetical protein